jgi:hypothetical protein
MDSLRGLTVPALLAIVIARLCVGTGMAQPTNYYGGLLNTALGNATLQVNATGGGLTVSGIGSSGNDGVQIATGGSGGGATLNLGVYNPDILSADASLTWIAIGRNDGRLQQIDLRNVAGGGASIFADFTGLGAPTVSVALYSNDTLVASASGIPPTTALATFTTAGTPHSGGLPMIINPCILNPGACYGNVDFILSIPDPTGPNGSVITLPGQGPMFCTRMQISPGYPVPYFMPTYQVKATTVTGHNLGSIYIGQEGYVYVESEGFSPGSFEHHVIGQARYDLSTPGVLAFNNTGPSGNDGVDVELRNANTYGLDMVALNPQPLPPVQSPMMLSITATGQLAGAAAEQSLGTLGFVNQETNIGLSADLSSFGAAIVHVELWQGCALVSSYDAANGGIVLTSGQGATGVSVGYDPGDDPCGTTPPLPPWWWWVKWPSPVQLTTPAGPVMADHVRVAADATTTSSLLALTHVASKITQTAGAFLHELGHNFGLNHGGNQHFPLGQATLGITATGQLNAANLGPSGLDGVAIYSGGVQWSANAGSIVNRPPLNHKFYAMLDNIRDRHASTLTLTSNPAGDSQFSGDMSPLGATHYSVLVLDGGTQVAKVTNQPAPIFSVSNAVTFIPSLRSDFVHSNCYIRIRLPRLPGDPGPVIRLSPTLTATGDEVIMMAEDPLRCAGPQSRVLLTAPGADSFQIGTEELGYFGNGHTALGTAMLSADGGVVGVGHIGSSGSNGVSIDLSGSLNALASFAPLDFSAVQAPGSPVPWVQAGIVGSLGGLPNQDLGSLRFTSAVGGGAQITADFSPIGGDTHTIEIWNGAQLVQRIAGHTGGTIGTIDNFPNAVGLQSTGSPTSAPGLIAAFGQVTHISVMGQLYQGDGIRVYPENPTQPVSALNALHLLGSGFDSLTVTNETTTPAVTPTLNGISPAPSGNVALSVPTVFGYDYTLEAVDSISGPHPWPWAPVSTFFGDGSVQQIMVPAVQVQQFFRVRVQGPGM